MTALAILLGHRKALIEYVRKLEAAQPAHSDHQPKDPDSMSVKQSSECHWSQDGEDSDVWATQCGHYFTLNDGTPSENEMRFCCYCGKPLTEIRFEDEQA